jgi:surface antigen
LLAGSASADQFDDQIGTLQQQASNAQSQANGFQAQADDYQTKVNQLQAQINALQAQINLNQAEYTQVQSEIAANQTKLDQEKVVLGANIKQMYLDQSVSPLEMLASTQNISQFLDEQQYQDKIKTSIQNAMTQVEQLQQTLDGQQKQLTQILTNLHGQQTQIASTEAQMNQLLALAQSNASAANAQVQADNNQISSLRAQQAAMWARLNPTNGSGNIGSFVFKNLQFGGACGGGYPSYLCDPAVDSSVDPWGMLNRECVSFVAYKIASSGRNMPNWGGSGNAYQWPSDAAQAGIPVDNTPRAGDAVIAPASMIGGVGHAMYVEYLESDGWVHVQQYNLWPTDNGPYGIYSEMDLKVVPGLEFIHF